MGIFEKIFKKNQNEEISFIIDLREQGVFIDGNEISFPIDIDKLEEIFGKATQQYWEDNDWRIIWENYGICTSGLQTGNRSLPGRRK